MDLNKNTPDKPVTSIILKTMALMGAGIIILFSVYALVIYFMLDNRTSRPPLDVSKAQINTQSQLQYQIELSSIIPNEFMPTSAQVEITRIIRRDEFDSSCSPSRNEIGTEHSFKETPAVQVSQGVVRFIATYDYIDNEEVMVKGACDYGIAVALMTIQSKQAIFTATLSPEDFHAFGRGDKSIVLFCISDNKSTDQISTGYCRSSLNDLPVDNVLKHHATFIVRGDFH